MCTICDRTMFIGKCPHTMEPVSKEDEARVKKFADEIRELMKKHGTDEEAFQKQFRNEFTNQPTITEESRRFWKGDKH